ncbi:DNA cross-link repair 1A protein-like, partial [Argonauta hians]
DDELECSVIRYKASNCLSTPVKKTTMLRQDLEFHQSKNVQKPSAKKSKGKVKSSPKIRKKSSTRQSSLSSSTQATLSIENKKLIITPPKLSVPSSTTSKHITPTKLLVNSPCSSITKSLSQFQCTSPLSPVVPAKYLPITPSKLLNALDYHDEATYVLEQDRIHSTITSDSNLSLLPNSDTHKRQLFLSEDPDNNYSNENRLKLSSSSPSPNIKSQDLFTTTDDKHLNSTSPQYLSDSDSDFVSPIIIPESPSPGLSAVAGPSLHISFQPSSYNIPSVKDVDDNSHLVDSGVDCETHIKSPNIKIESSLEPCFKEIPQTVAAVMDVDIDADVDNKIATNKMFLPTPSTPKKKVQRMDFYSPTKLSSSSKRRSNPKTTPKKSTTLNNNQTCLTSFFQRNDKDISSMEVDESMLVPVTRNDTKITESIPSKNIPYHNTTTNDDDGDSNNNNKPMISLNTSKKVLTIDQFKQLFHKPSVKQKIAVIPEQPSTSETRENNKDKDKKFNSQSCPFYKKIPGTNFTVDAFKYGVIPGCQAYFLTHFHYDHYQGLTKHFSQPLYCSEVTANLVKLKIGVSNQYIHPLPLYCPVVIDSVEVTLMDANHCPGSVLILMRYSEHGMKKTILHTGDFRADSIMEEYNALKNVKINQLYLDTTYCDPQYVFPGQQEVLDFCVFLVKSFLEENPQTLIVVGTYTIGKEKVFLALAKAIGSKIGVTKEKKRLLDCLQSITMDKLVTLDLKSCSIHVVKMNNLNYRDLTQHLKRYERFDKLLALKPTGWTHSKNRTSLYDIQPTLKTDNIILYGIPYSEHSSFSEMKRFVKFTRPDTIIPTVNNGNAASRKFMQDTFYSWLSE